MKAGWSVYVEVETTNGKIPDQCSLRETIEVAVSELVKGNNSVTATIEDYNGDTPAADDPIP